MREYELVFIVHPDLDENATNEVVDRVNLDSTSLAGNFLYQLLAETPEFLGNLITINRYRDDRCQNIMTVSAAADGRA